MKETTDDEMDSRQRKRFSFFFCLGLLAEVLDKVVDKVVDKVLDKVVDKQRTPPEGLAWSVVMVGVCLRKGVRFSDLVRGSQAHVR